MIGKIKKILKNCIRILRGDVFYLEKDSYCDDGLATNHLNNFKNDKNFLKIYSEATKHQELGNHKGNIHYRAYIVSYFANYCKNIEGDFVELGCGKGIYAKIIFEYCEFYKCDKIFFLFDTFNGIPIELAKPEENKMTKMLNETAYKVDYYDFVKKKFDMYKNCKIINGRLPGSLKNIEISKISFLHIDLNNAESEISSIEEIYNKINIGGIVILDDYAYSKDFLTQKKSWDKFSNSKNFKILSLPTGQGFFIKTKN
tara:strand:+ start:29 stop:799 length:771 start_codon:yes stop_codon:yes gene_type:complete